MLINLNLQIENKTNPGNTKYYIQISQNTITWIVSDLRPRKESFVKSQNYGSVWYAKNSTMNLQYNIINKTDL